MAVTRGIRPLLGVVAGGLLLCALLLGPRSCSGGLEWYLGLGLFALIVIIVLSWVFNATGHRTVPILLGVLAVIGSWILGLFIGGFQILCRLF